jgi:predicted dithiol-disulfide oxidoreductase (DUF899 family)
MNPFPGESEEYRSAREELLSAESELRRHEERVAAQRRDLPLGGEVQSDYEFAGVGGPVLMSELFEDGKDTLFLHSFMFIPGSQGLALEGACPSCTSIIDGMDGGRSQLPIATVFTRSGGAIHHVWSSELFGAPTDPVEHPRHVDFMWPIWAVLDRTPAGRGTDWQPRLTYR